MQDNVHQSGILPRHPHCAEAATNAQAGVPALRAVVVYAALRVIDQPASVHSLMTPAPAPQSTRKDWCLCCPGSRGPHSGDAGTAGR
jgi:hypothetical protein